MRNNLLALAIAAAIGGTAAAQTPTPTPQPAYPSITVTGTLQPGTYQLVPSTDLAGWQQQKQQHQAKLQQLRTLAQQILDQTAPPAPAPVPAPAPAPKPAPAPAPAAAAGGNLHLVVVETPQGALTRGKLFTDPGLSTLVKLKNDHWRIVSKDVVGPDGQPPADIAPYLQLAAGQALPQLYIVTGQGKMVWSGPLPASPAEMCALITKVGG